MILFKLRVIKPALTVSNSENKLYARSRKAWKWGSVIQAQETLRNSWILPESEQKNLCFKLGSPVGRWERQADMGCIGQFFMLLAGGVILWRPLMNFSLCFWKLLPVNYTVMGSNWYISKLQGTQRMEDSVERNAEACVRDRWTQRRPPWERLHGQEQ